MTKLIFLGVGNGAHFLYTTLVFQFKMKKENF